MRKLNISKTFAVVRMRWNTMRTEL